MMRVAPVGAGERGASPPNPPPGGESLPDPRFRWAWGREGHGAPFTPAVTLSPSRPQAHSWRGPGSLSAPGRRPRGQSPRSPRPDRSDTP